MKRKLVFVVLLLGIIGLIVGIFRIVSDRMPSEGVLKINSRPTVSIFINNRQVSNTPFEEKMDQGEYSLKLVPESNIEPVASWQGTVKVMPNLLTYVNADLAQTEFESAIEILWLEKATTRQSEIAIVSTPDSVSVSLDGEPRGVAPIVLSEITVGDHTISLSSEGFLPRTIKVKTTAGYRLMISAKLALSSQPSPQIPSASPSAVLSGIDEEEGEIASDSSAIGDDPALKPSPIAAQAITPTLKPPAKPYVLIKDTPTGFLRVRFEPTTQSTEAAKVNPGEMFPYLATDNGWYKIRYLTDSEGWVTAQYAEKVE